MRTYRVSIGRKLLFAAAAITLMCICAAQAQAFPPDPDRTFTVIPKHTMTGTNGSVSSSNPIKCLDVSWFSYSFYAKVVQSNCLGGNNQRWGAMGQLTDLQLVAGHSMQCLGVEHNSREDAKDAVQLNCDGDENPSINWRAVHVDTLAGFKFYRIFNVNSSKCLDVAWASKDAGARVVQATCTGTDNQLWFFYNVSNGTLGL